MLYHNNCLSFVCGLFSKARLFSELFSLTEHRLLRVRSVCFCLCVYTDMHTHTLACAYMYDWVVCFATWCLGCPSSPSPSFASHLGKRDTQGISFWYPWCPSRFPSPFPLPMLTPAPLSLCTHHAEIVLKASILNDVVFGTSYVGLLCALLHDECRFALLS